jgi:signal transduction histidine kinase/DNA-binding response OmpR family regulator
MSKSRERILLVESDPDVSDLISRQTLQPLGYQVQVAESSNLAIQDAVTFAPDVMLVNLTLPGLSGKDLLVALSSQNLDIPIIVLADKGMESDVIQAFRLGASDYLRCPVREAEVVSAVERALKQVRSRREKETLERQLNQANQELQRRVRELTTIFAIGKAMTSITNQRTLLDKVVEGAVYVTEADSGWLLLREDRSKNFILSACRNLPKPIAEKINQPWDDGISSLVALSGEALSIHGDPLKRFKVSRLGQAALVVPIKIKKEVVGLLVVVRKANTPFGPGNQNLLEAVADYASISLVNAHLFNALEERAQSMQKVAERAVVNERIKDDILQSINQELLPPLKSVRNNLTNIGSKAARLSEEQRELVSSGQEHLALILESLDALTALHPQFSKNTEAAFNLIEMARQTMSRYQKIAYQAGVGLLAELASQPIMVYGSPSQVSQVFEGLLSNAIKYNTAGGQVILKVETLRVDGSQMAHVQLKDTGCGIDAKNLEKVFERKSRIREKPAARFGGIGISLSLVREVIVALGGKVWVESEPEAGSIFHFTLPLYNK